MAFNKTVYTSRTKNPRARIWISAQVKDWFPKGMLVFSNPSFSSISQPTKVSDNRDNNAATSLTVDVTAGDDASRYDEFFILGSSFPQSSLSSSSTIPPHTSSLEDGDEERNKDDSNKTKSEDDKSETKENEAKGKDDAVNKANLAWETKWLQELGISKYDSMGMAWLYDLRRLTPSKMRLCQERFYLHCISRESENQIRLTKYAQTSKKESDDTIKALSDFLSVGSNNFTGEGKDPGLVERSFFSRKKFN
jgi:hypothetical protein